VADPKTSGDLFFESYCALNGYDTQHGGALARPLWRYALGRSISHSGAPRGSVSRPVSTKPKLR
jgi:hypothetical protein